MFKVKVNDVSNVDLLKLRVEEEVDGFLHELTYQARPPKDPRQLFVFNLSCW